MIETYKIHFSLLLLQRKLPHIPKLIYKERQDEARCSINEGLRSGKRFMDQDKVREEDLSQSQMGFSLLELEQN